MIVINVFSGYCVVVYGVSLGAYMLRHWVYAHNYSWVDAE